jgi:hypothetical protein
MISVAQDGEGLKLAALELLEESMDAPERARMEKLAATAANAQAILDSIPNRRTLSRGSYAWVTSIMECVVQPMESGVAFRLSDLDCEEMIAIRAIQEARAEFRRLHPPCRRCGRALPEIGLKFCVECEHERFDEETRRR